MIFHAFSAAYSHAEIFILFHLVFLSFSSSLLFVNMFLIPFHALPTFRFIASSFHFSFMSLLHFPFVIFPLCFCRAANASSEVSRILYILQ